MEPPNFCLTNKADFRYSRLNPLSGSVFGKN